jgi:plastocyanin
MKIVLDMAVAAFVLASLSRSVLGRRRQHVRVAKRGGAKAILGMTAAALVVGSVARASADEAGGMAMDMPGMKMGATTIAVAPAEPNAVNIDNFAFGPPSITVAAGTKVTWTNRDDEPHTVTSADDPKLFRSAALDTNDSFSFTFDKPGTYRYFCSIHPQMTGTVVVK